MFSSTAPCDLLTTANEVRRDAAEEGTHTDLFRKCHGRAIRLNQGAQNLFICDKVLCRIAMLNPFDTTLLTDVCLLDNEPPPFHILREPAFLEWRALITSRGERQWGAMAELKVSVVRLQRRSLPRVRMSLDSELRETLELIKVAEVEAAEAVEQVEERELAEPMEMAEVGRMAGEISSPSRSSRSAV